MTCTPHTIHGVECGIDLGLAELVFEVGNYVSDAVAVEIR